MKRGIAFLAINCAPVLFWQIVCAQIITDNRPIAGTLQCEQVIIPQNDPWLVNVFPEHKIIEQSSDDEAYWKWAEEATRKKLEKERTPKTQNGYTPDNPIETSVLATPVLGKNFKGNSSAGNVPPDCGFAISNSGYIVSVINGSVVFYDTNGVSLQSSTLYGFMQESSSAQVYDPRVIYDPVYNKFVFCANSGIAGGKAILLFSTSDDPKQAWNKYTLTLPNMGASTADWIDYPHMGITDNELFLGVTVYVGGGNTQKFPIIQINKKSGYAGTTLKYNTWINQASQPGDCTIPVTIGQQNNPYGNTAYLLQTRRTGGSSIYLYKISDTIGASPALIKYTLTTNAYSPSGNVAQKGSASTLSTSNCRPMSAFFLNGIIHYVFHLNYNNTGYYGIRYGRIDVNNSNAQQISHIHNSSNQIDFCFPTVSSIGSSPGDKSVAITFQTSGTSIYPSVQAAVCDDLMNWSSPITVKNGTGAISGGRWGDYTCSSRKHDSSQPTVWACSQYGKSGAGLGFEMWIAEIKTSSVNGTTNVNELAQHNTVFPNPVIDLFNLQFSSPKDQTIKIDILDMTGRQVKALYNAPVNHGMNTLSFNKGALVHGIYLIRILSSVNQLILQDKLVIED